MNVMQSGRLLEIAESQPLTLMDLKRYGPGRWTWEMILVKVEI